MKLSNVDRERITDSMLKIQSAKATLEQVASHKIDDAEAIEDCLDAADESLKATLGYGQRKPH